MINFFRKIRFDLMGNNPPVGRTGKTGKTSRYLKYALGEIVLVIVGILIALQINNLNEERKNGIQIDSILREIQSDLGTDIQSAKELILYSQRKDSLIQRIEQDKFTYDDYKNNIGNLYIISDIDHMKIHTIGYDNLIRLIDIIPTDSKSIIRPLNKIYVDIKYEIDKYDQRANQITDQYLDDMVNKNDWSYLYHTGVINDTIIAYFLNNPRYKNEANRYKLTISRQSTWAENFIDNAVAASLDISKLLRDKKEFHTYVPSDLIDIPQDEMAALAGTYRITKIGNRDIPFSNASYLLYDIITEHNRIVFRQRGGDRTKNYYATSSDEFYSTLAFLFDNKPGYDEKIQFKRDSTNKVIGYVYTKNNSIIETIKITKNQ